MGVARGRVGAYRIISKRDNSAYDRCVSKRGETIVIREEIAKKRPVLVATSHRGVFFGYLEDDSKSPKEVKLSCLRNCIYWSQDIEGVVGLSTFGPSEKCKIGAMNHGISTVYDVTLVAPVSKEAEKKWRK